MGLQYPPQPNIIVSHLNLQSWHKNCLMRSIFLKNVDRKIVVIIEPDRLFAIKLQFDRYLVSVRQMAWKSVYMTKIGTRIGKQNSVAKYQEKIYTSSCFLYQVTRYLFTTGLHFLFFALKKIQKASMFSFCQQLHPSLHPR